jgi:PTH2 family peptidyl-tRNA hydrolase
MEPKQVIVMRRDLGMRRGKEIAQGAHASMIWLSLRIREPGYGFTEAERTWLDGSFTKVCVRVDSEEELLGIGSGPISW